MKNLAKLNGAKALSKNEQKSINGGWDTGFCSRLCNGQYCNIFANSDWRYTSCGCPNACGGGIINPKE